MTEQAPKPNEYQRRKLRVRSTSGAPANRQRLAERDDRSRSRDRKSLADEGKRQRDTNKAIADAIGQDEEGVGERIGASVLGLHRRAG